MKKKIIIAIIFISMIGISYRFYINKSSYGLVKNKIIFNEELTEKELKQVKKKEKLLTEKELYEYIKKSGNSKNYKILPRVYKEEKDIESKKELIELFLNVMEEERDHYQALKILEEIKSSTKVDKEIKLINEKLVKYYETQDMFEKADEIRKNIEGGKK